METSECSQDRSLSNRRRGVVGDEEEAAQPPAIAALGGTLERAAGALRTRGIDVVVAGSDRGYLRGAATSLRLPENRPGFVWRVQLDTSDDARRDAPTRRRTPNTASPAPANPRANHAGIVLPVAGSRPSPGPSILRRR